MLLLILHLIQVRTLALNIALLALIALNNKQ